MATNKLLPFANGVGANVTDYDTWSALTTLLSQGFTTGVARSDYANRVFAQGALASYILGQFVVDQTAQDADLNETTFYTNFKNALTAYIKTNAVSLDTAQTVGGVKTFTSSPIVPTADAADSSTKAASTAFVQGELTSQAVKLTGAQTIDGVKTFTSSPVVPTETAGDNSTNTASTAFVQTEIANQAVKFDSAQTLTDAEKIQARSNIGAPADSDVVKLATAQTISGDKNFTGALQHDGYGVDTVVASGSNYIRYGSGLQICWGNAYSPADTATIQVNFQVPFNGLPGLSFCGTEYEVYLTGGGVAVSYFSISKINAIISRDIYFRWVAIGTWK